MRCRALVGFGRSAIIGLLALAALSTAASAHPHGSPDVPRRVVILNATDPYLPAFLVLDEALREAIRAGRDAPAEFYAEPLDMYRFPQARYEDDLVTLLGKKYHGLKVDVVVAATSLALDFARRHRAELWPGAVIVFHSVPDTVLAETSLEPGIIGVPVQLAFGPTIDLIARLRPATRRILIVAGTADPDRRYLALARAALERAAPRFEVGYLVGLTFADTLAALRALPSDVAVLYVMVFRDGAGAPKVPRDVLTRIAEVSPVPVFGLFETYLGHGIVAGSIASYREQGRLAGELVVRVLNGEDPGTIGVQPAVRSICRADWRQLRRWGIDERLLPMGCEVWFREVTTWERYRWQIVAVLAVILAQTALILVLVLQRRRLREAQVTLAHEYSRRTRAESLAARLRARLARSSRERSVGVMAAAIAHEVNQPLTAIQNYAQAVRRRLRGEADDRPALIELFAKIEGQAERAGAIIGRVRALADPGAVRVLPVPMRGLLAEVIGMMTPEIETRGCHLCCEVAADLPMVSADSLQIQLVLANLLQNALQSVCAAGRDDRRLVVEVRSHDARTVCISVADRGGGVAPERAADIFEPLYSTTSGGMGMGLAIAQAIVEAHGGRLWYEPNPGGGAIFSFTLRTAGS